MGLFNWMRRKPRDFTELTERLKDSNAWMDKTEAIEEFAKIGRPAVEHLLGSMRDPATRWGAITALGDIGNSRAIDPIIEALNDIDPQIRGAAVVALGKIGGSRVVKPLIKVLDTEGRPFGSMHQLVIEALVNSKDQKAIDALKDRHILRQ